MKAILTFSFCFAVFFTLAGCATAPNSAYSYSPAQQQQDKDKLIEAQDQFLEKIKAENLQLHKQVDKLQTENKELKKTKLIETDGKAISDHLQINDNIVENKKVILQSLQKEWEKEKNKIFEAIGGTGKLKEFEVEDVFLYKGTIDVTTVFVWSNQDGTGGIARGCMRFDPDKNDEFIDCSVLGQALISAQELANLDEGKAAEVEQQANRITRRPESSGGGLSEKTKDHLWQAGLIALPFVLKKLFEAD